MESNNNSVNNDSTQYSQTAEKTSENNEVTNASGADNKPGFWQRAKALVTNRKITHDSQDDQLLNDGNILTTFIARYIKRRQCPYCFGFVTRKVYRLRTRKSGNVNVSGISMSLPGIKIYECPSCSAELPSDFFRNRSSSIAIVGGTDSGKSSFITIFCELLLHRRSVLNELGIFGSIINIEGVELMKQNQLLLIQQERALNPTASLQQPVVVRLYSKHHKRVTYITLLDTPGENFLDKDEILATMPNLQYADGLIFLMNPLDIEEIFRMLRKERPGDIPLNRAVRVNNFQLIEILYEMFMECGRVKPNRKIKTPAAFCLSRADILDNLASIYFPPDFEPDLSALDDIINESKLVAEDLRELMEETDLNLVNVMDKRFKKYSLFPVSPLGKTPISDAMGQRIEGGVNPKGVLQPIIWILSEINFIQHT